MAVMGRERRLPDPEEGVAVAANGADPGERSVRRQIHRHLLEDLWSELEEVTETGDLAELGNLLASTTLELDAKAYAEVLEVLDETLDRTLEILRESSERLQALPAEERDQRRTQLAILHYPRSRHGRQSG
jgi:hypothetical protein